jgi:hypothetical protein
MQKRRKTRPEKKPENFRVFENLKNREENPLYIEMKKFYFF